MSDSRYRPCTELKPEHRIFIQRGEDQKEVCVVGSLNQANCLADLLNQGLPEHEALAPYDDAYAQYWSTCHIVRESTNPQIGWVVYDRQGVAIANRLNETDADAYAKELDDSSVRSDDSAQTEEALQSARALLRLVEVTALANFKKVRMFRMDYEPARPYQAKPTWCGVVISGVPSRDLITVSSPDLDKVLDQVISFLNELP